MGLPVVRYDLGVTVGGEAEGKQGHCIVRLVHGMDRKLKAKIELLTNWTGAVESEEAQDRTVEQSDGPVRRSRQVIRNSNTAVLRQAAALHGKNNAGQPRNFQGFALGQRALGRGVTEGATLEETRSNGRTSTPPSP